jgi:hypothetical protein
VIASVPVTGASEYWRGASLDRVGLVNEHPAVAAQWHPDLNAGLDLAQIGPCSHKAVFWRCDDGHVWQAQRRSSTATRPRVW